MRRSAGSGQGCDGADSHVSWALRSGCSFSSCGASASVVLCHRHSSESRPTRCRRSGSRLMCPDVEETVAAGVRL